MNGLSHLWRIKVLDERTVRYARRVVLCARWWHISRNSSPMQVEQWMVVRVELVLLGHGLCELEARPWTRIVNVVRIDEIETVPDTGQEAGALRIVLIPVKVALTVLDTLIVCVQRDQCMLSKVRWDAVRIGFDLCATVTDQDAAQVDFLDFAAQISIVDTFGQGGNVMTGKALTGNVKVTVDHLRILCEKVQQKVVGIICRDHIIVLDIVGWCLAVRVTDTGRSFQIEHVGHLVPRVVIDTEGFTVGIDHEGTVFRGETSQA